MKLLITLVTYNRLELTKRTLKSLLKTIDVPYYLVVVDNYSTDGTAKWLLQQEEAGKIHQVIFNVKNYYPGKATNQGWKLGLKEYNPTHLMRSDNDIIYYEGWASKAKKYFSKINQLGQLGLEYSVPAKAPDQAFMWNFRGVTLKSPTRTKVNGMELVIWPGSVSGTCIIDRKIWDSGIIYNEEPWTDNGEEVNPLEDAIISGDILNAGYYYGFAGERLAETIGNPEDYNKYPEYYRKSLSDRGLLRKMPELEKYFKEDR